ncbi:MAG TPA: hypothetical protein VF666_09135 [Pyrinomonadaceae bacterium]
MRRKRIGACWRFVVVWLVCATLATATGCKKDADVDEVLGELDGFTKELVSKVETAPNPSAGVDEAQKLMDARRAEIASKLESLKNVRGADVSNSEETKNKMLESVTNNIMSVAGLQIKYMSQSMQDPSFKAKLDKLVGDYQSLFKM